MFTAGGVLVARGGVLRPSMSHRKAPMLGFGCLIQKEFLEFLPSVVPGQQALARTAWPHPRIFQHLCLAPEQSQTNFVVIEGVFKVDEIDAVLRDAMERSAAEMEAAVQQRHRLQPAWRAGSAQGRIPRRIGPHGQAGTTAPEDRWLFSGRPELYSFSKALILTVRCDCRSGLRSESDLQEGCQGTDRLDRRYYSQCENICTKYIFQVRHGLAGDSLALPTLLIVCRPCLNN
jgi:hypothetical protein